MPDIEKLKAALRTLALACLRDDPVTGFVITISRGSYGYAMVPEEDYVAAWKVAHDLLHETDAAASTSPSPSALTEEGVTEEMVDAALAAFWCDKHWDAEINIDKASADLTRKDMKRALEAASALSPKGGT